MTRSRLCLVISSTLLLAMGSSFAQNIEIPDWDNSVTFEIVASQTPVRPGDRFEIALVADIVEGYHLYGPEENPPSRTAVTFSSPTLEVGEVVYPPVITRDLSGLGEFDLYEGKIAIRVPATASEAATGTGSHAVALTIDYQVCTDYACSAPTSDELSVELVAAAADASVTRTHEEIFKNLK